MPFVERRFDVSAFFSIEIGQLSATPHLLFYITYAEIPTLPAAIMRAPLTPAPPKCARFALVFSCTVILPATHARQTQYIEIIDI